MSTRPLLAHPRQRGASRSDSYGSVAGLGHDSVSPQHAFPSSSPPPDPRRRDPHPHHLGALRAGDDDVATSRSDPLPARTLTPSEHIDDGAILSETKAHVAAGQIESGIQGPLMASSAMPAEIGCDAIRARSHRSSRAENIREPGHGESDDPDDVDDRATARDTLLHRSHSRDSRSSSFSFNHADPIDNSPYPQVRASVAATDDISLSINTPRMWFLSMFFAVLGSATNMFFSLRYPSVSITPVIALLLVHPLGLVWDVVLKRAHDLDETFVLGDLHQRHGRPKSSDSADLAPPSPPPASGTLDRVRLWLAQGRWNEKEHACVYIASNVSFGFAFATDVSLHSRSSRPPMLIRRSRSLSSSPCSTSKKLPSSTSCSSPSPPRSSVTPLPA